MTTKDSKAPISPERLQQNLARIESLTARLAEVLAHKKMIRPSLQGPGPEFFGRALGAFWAEVAKNPTKVWEEQVEYWGKTLQNAIEAQKALLAGTDEEESAEGGKRDRRFSNPLWHKHPWFRYLRQQYQLTADMIERSVDELEDVDEAERRRIRFFTRQIIDMMAPTNFLATNPDALQRAIETEGQSLIDGLENMIRDLERNDGELLPTLSDPEAFKVGVNLATTEGAVVYRNRMFELIQYAPRTETVHKTPLIIFPPWINKFYILDLRPENSLVRWIVDQGYTLFVVSWVNPDHTYADVGMVDYVEDGLLAAMREVKAITGEEKINVVGYCIAGTTLALTLSLMHQRGDRSVNAASFLTTLTDFSDPGEVGVFLEDDFVDGIEAEAKETGVMGSLYMKRTFSFLRANDLVYKPAIEAYMLGKAPPAFDLLYWNGDGTNLPGKMAVEYLRGLCQRDEFAHSEQGFALGEHRLRISDVDVPLCAVACESDHIAPWRLSYRGIRLMGSKDKTFLLSESGHVAGIVNPPTRKKYGHYTNPDWPAEPEDWKAGATFHKSSWWPQWEKWLAPRSGEMVPAREPGGKDHPPLCPAPGTYVLASPKI
ncbi:MAG: class I poly(R)-hydroxyalkanoic acid synthase [Alphaproteobacteria bacterium]|nr:MAG: class I poly(R)-hydroxyalkanoic acid synthase [Alphaproteobacteria bacterium]